MLILLLNVIGINNLDILSDSSIYTNSYAVSILELSTELFILWFIVLGLIRIINYLTYVIEGSKLTKETVTMINPVVEEVLDVNNNVQVEVDIKEEIKDEEESKAYEDKDLVGIHFWDNAVKLDNLNNDNKIEVSYIESNNKQEVVEGAFDKILNNKIPVIREEVVTENVTVKEDVSINKVETNESFTLDDYKLFSKMLQTVRENNGNKQELTLNDCLSINLLSRFSVKEYNLFKKMLKEVKEG